MIGKSEINKKKVRIRVTSLVLLTILLFSLCSLSGAASKNSNDQELMSQVFAAAEANLGKITPENTLIISDIGSPAESYVFLDSFYSKFYKENFLYTKNLLISPECKKIAPLLVWLFSIRDKREKCTFY